MRRLKQFAHAVWSVATGIFTVLVAALRLAFGTLRILRGGSLLAFDFARSRRSLKSGVLHCPRGHAIETEGGVYQCAKCGFTYRGSILLCANPECMSPVTQYVDCPDCGISVRNPYRWGRP